MTAKGREAREIMLFFKEVPLSGIIYEAPFSHTGNRIIFSAITGRIYVTVTTRKDFIFSEWIYPPRCKAWTTHYAQYSRSITMVAHVHRDMGKRLSLTYSFQFSLPHIPKPSELVMETHLWQETSTSILTSCSILNFPLPGRKYKLTRTGKGICI